jgi:hypothetical protein
MGSIASRDASPRCDGQGAPLFMLGECTSAFESQHARHVGARTSDTCFHFTGLSVTQRALSLTRLCAVAAAEFLVEWSSFQNMKTWKAGERFQMLYKDEEVPEYEEAFCGSVLATRFVPPLGDAKSSLGDAEPPSSFSPGATLARFLSPVSPKETTDTLAVGGGRRTQGEEAGRGGLPHGVVAVGVGDREVGLEPAGGGVRVARQPLGDAGEILPLPVFPVT